MEKETILDRIKKLTCKISWRIFLWSINLNEEEYCEDEWQELRDSINNLKP